MTVRGESGQPGRFRFNEFEADLRTGELLKRGERVRLAEQPLQILALLLERRGELVTREQMRDRLWPGEIYVDFERGLNTVIRTLRRALGDSPKQPRFIETLPKRGYRFIAKVEVVGADAEDAAGRPGSPPPAFRRRKLILATASAGLLVVLLGAWVGRKPGLTPAERADELLAALPAGLPHVWGAISPDGRFLARRDGDSGLLYLRDLTSGAERLLVPDPVERGLIWSPDGEQVAYLRRRNGEHWIETVRVDSAESRALLGLGPVRALPNLLVPAAWDTERKRLLVKDWLGDRVGFLSLESPELIELDLPKALVSHSMSLSPDGRFLASATDAGDIIVHPIDPPGEPIQVTESDEREDHPLWSSDGKALVFLRFPSNDYAKAELWAASLVLEPNGPRSNGPPFRLADIHDVRRGVPPVLSASGDYLWAKQEPVNRLNLLPVDPSSGRPTGEPLTELPRGYWGGYWAGEGSLLRVEPNLEWDVPGRTVFHELDVATGQESLVQAPRPEGERAHVNYHPDLSRGVLISRSKEGGARALYYDATTDELTEVLASEYRLAGASLSPDSAQIAFLETESMPGEPGWIGVADVESKKQRRLFKGRRLEGPRWSPDGAEVAFADRPCVYILDVSSGEAEKLACYPDPSEQYAGVRTASPEWSPDGSMLVWAALNPAKERNEVWVIDRASGERSVIWIGEPEYATEAWHPSWSADGRYLALTLIDKPAIEIWKIRHPLLLDSVGESLSE